MWQEARYVAKCQSCGKVPELSNLSATCYTGKEPYKCSNPTYSRLASCLSISPLKCLVMATPRRIRILGMRLDLCRIGSDMNFDAQNEQITCDGIALTASSAYFKAVADIATMINDRLEVVQ